MKNNNRLEAHRQMILVLAGIMFILFLTSFTSAINITLISPEDDSIQYTNQVTFNATASTNSGYLTNMSLWTNNTGSWEKTNTIDFSSEYYVLIYASSIDETQLEINGVSINSYGDGIWKMNSTQGKAGVLKTLFYGTDGSNPRVLSGITGLTELKSSDSRDINKKGYYIKYVQTGVNNIATYYNASFDNDDNNVVVGAYASTTGNTGYSHYSAVYFPYNTVITGGTQVEGKTDDDTGTLISYNNPNSIVLYGDLSGVGGSATLTQKAYFITSSDMTFAEVDTPNIGSPTLTNFYTTYNIPAFTGIYYEEETLILSSRILWNVQACDSDGDCGFATSNYTFTLDSQEPIINVLYPTTLIDYEKDRTSLNLNVSVSDTNLDSCWYSYEGTNYSTTCNTNTSFISGTTKTLTYYANDTVGNLNSEVTTWDYKIFENSRTYNTTSYETAYETYQINITSNSSLTAVSLLFNGTAYSMINQGSGIWSYSRDLPSSVVGNNSIQFRFTYDGDYIYSANSTQVVSPLVFVNCNSTYATKFINFTFKDENTLNILNGTIPYSEFVYYLGDGTINKTYTFTNTTSNISSFTFCSNAINSTLKVNPTIQYIATSYPQRIYQPSTLTLTNVTTNKSLYLLGVSDGIFVTYQVLTTSNQPIEGVDVVSTRTILGEEVVIGVGQTDASGIVTFWENPDFQHSTTFSKTGYDSYVFNHFPTRSEYTISLGEQVEIPESLTRGISFVILPKKTFLYENTINTFSLSLSSNYNDLEEFGFSLTYSNGTLIGSNSSTSALGGIITLQNINISTTKNITMVSYYVIDGKTTLLNPTYWIIQTLDGTQYSIKNLFNEFDTYSSSDFWGFGDFERIILSILILILMVGGLSRRYGITNEATITSMIFGVVALLDVVLEFIPEITIPATGVTLPQGTLTAITFLILIVLLIMEER